MAKTILNPFQQKVLQVFKTSVLIKKFYLSGGTALAEFYLQHRRSEDLDFFTQEELDLDELKKFINLIAKKTGVIEVQFQHGFGLYFILQKEKDWGFQELLQRSFEKFEMKTDSLQLGENLLQVKTLKDMPEMVKKLDLLQVQDFFLKELKELKTKIWK